MLLTDGNPNSTEDLRVYESAVLSVAHTETIDLQVKLGLATEEVAQDVLNFLLNRASGTDPRADARRAIGVSDVVVTRQMKRWHALHALAVFYRDAFHNQFNDRYKAKFAEYWRLATQAREQVYSFGVGVVSEPLPMAETPVFGYVVGPIEAQTYFGQVAWTNAVGAAGAPSAMTSFDAPAGSVPRVAAVKAPAGATGFHVYLGLTPEGVTRQTADPVAVDVTFTLSASGLVQGAAAGDGQAADVYLTGGPTLRRG